VLSLPLYPQLPTEDGQLIAARISDFFTKEASA
jgi:hypothetical protein